MPDEVPGLRWKKTEVVFIPEEIIVAVLKDVLAVVKNDPDTATGGIDFDEGCKWTINEIAARLKITLEEDHAHTQE